MPEAWPTSVSAVLPLVHVDIKPDSTSLIPVPMQRYGNPQERSGSAHSENRASGGAGAGGVTWDELKREGALLGVQGWTDRHKL